MFFLYLWVIVVILLISISFYIKIWINVVYNSDDGQLRIHLRIFKRIKRDYSYSLSGERFLSSILSADQPSDQKTPALLPAGGYIKMFLMILKHLLVEEFNWDTIIGTGDAMYTALGTGSMWALQGTIIGYLSSLSTIKDLHINIQPDFRGSTIRSEFNCILKIRIVHIIITAIYIFWLIIRRYLNGCITAGKPQPSH